MEHIDLSADVFKMVSRLSDSGASSGCNARRSACQPAAEHTKAAAAPTR